MWVRHLSLSNLSHLDLMADVAMERTFPTSLSFDFLGYVARGINLRHVHDEPDRGYLQRGELEHALFIPESFGG
jgi:hypothetical protein